MSVTSSAPVSERLEALLAEAEALLSESVNRSVALQKALTIVDSQGKSSYRALTLLTDAARVIKASHIQPSEPSSVATIQPYEGYRIVATRPDGVDIWIHEYDRPDAPDKAVVFSIWPLEYLKRGSEYQFPEFVYDKAHSRFWAEDFNGRAEETAILGVLSEYGLKVKRYAKDKQDVKDAVFGMVEVHYPWSNVDGIGCIEKIVATHDTYGVAGIRGVLGLASSDCSSLDKLTGAQWQGYEQRWAKQQKVQLFTRAMRESPQGLGIEELDAWIDVITQESRALSFMTLGMLNPQAKMDDRLELIRQYRALRVQQLDPGDAPF